MKATVLKYVLTYCQKNGIKRSQRSVTEGRKKNERHQTRDGQRMRERSSGRRRREGERGNVHKIWKGDTGSFKPALIAHLSTNMWLLRGRRGGKGWTESLGLAEANFYI